jgi:hypothetical protein
MKRSSIGIMVGSANWAFSGWTRYDEGRPEGRPSIPTSETMAGRRHEGGLLIAFRLDHVTMSEKI